MPGPMHLIDKPGTTSRQSVRHKGKSTFENSCNEVQEIKKLKSKNDELVKQNTNLKEKCSSMEEINLRNKEKIKNLIIRINQVKNSNSKSGAKTLHPSTSQLPVYPISSSQSYALLPQKR